MSIGLRVKERRSILNMTQLGLAEKIEISLDMIKKIETDKAKPSLDTLEKLSIVLDCSADYLLGKTNNPFLNDRDSELYEKFLSLSKEDQDFLLGILKRIQSE